MIQRCTNPNNKEWHNYGGRGIKVCDKWASSYAAFRADVGEPSAGMFLDRIDNDGNYEPGNCQWSTISESAHNTRTTKLNSEVVKVIRFVCKRRKRRQSLLARLHGVDVSCVNSVLKGRSWKD